MRKILALVGLLAVFACSDDDTIVAPEEKMALSDLLIVAADDAPQEWGATPPGSHRAAISDEDDASFVDGRFLSASVEWYQLPASPAALAELRETRILWRLRDLIKGEDSVGHEITFTVYKSDKSTIIANVVLPLSIASSFDPIDMAPVFLIGDAAPADFPLYIRLHVNASGSIFSEERIRIARLRVQYLYDSVPTSGPVIIQHSTPIKASPSTVEIAPSTKNIVAGAREVSIRNRRLTPVTVSR